MSRASTFMNLFSETDSTKPGRDYYFAATGNDTTGTGLIGNPYQSIAKANSLTLNPCDRILFNGGDTFSGQITPSYSGNSLNWITYASYGIGNAIIDGSSAFALYMRDSSAMNFLRFEHLTFSGAYNPDAGATRSVCRVYTHDVYFYYCTVTDPGYAGSYAYIGADSFDGNSYNVTWDHCHFTYLGRSGLYSSSPNGTQEPYNCVAVDCEFDHCGQTGSGHGVYLCGGWLVDRALIHDTGKYPPVATTDGIKFSDLYHTDGVYTPELRNSYIHDVTGHGIYIESHGANVHHNKVVGTVHGPNLTLINTPASGGTTSDDAKIIYNTFINSSSQDGIYWEYPTGPNTAGHGVTFKNNIVIQDVAVVPARYCMNVGNTGTLQQIAAAHTFDYNIWLYRYTDGPTAHTFGNDADGTGRSFNDWKGYAGSQDAHSTLLTSLPDFVARYTDFRPVEFGNLAGLGTTVTGYDTDYNGEIISGTPTPGCYIPSFSISGTILDGTSTPVSDVTVALGAFSATTAGDGTYKIVGLSNGSSGNLTPSKAGWTFSPSTITIPSMSGTLSGKDFTATINVYTISGSVVASGSGLSGVSVALGSYSASTAGDGTYTISSVPYGTSGSLTPTKISYGFNPTSIAISPMSENLTNQSFSGSIVYYTISGTITDGSSSASGVNVALGAYSASTASDGTYTISNIPGGTSGSLVAAKSATVLAPYQRIISPMSGNLVGKNFTKVIYYVRHELNDFSEYGSTATDSGKMTVATPGLLSSSYCMDCLLDGSNVMYGSMTTVYTPTVWRAALALDVSGLSMANNSELGIWLLYNSAFSIVVYLRLLYTTGSGFQLKTSAYDDSAVAASTAYYAISSAEHTVEVRLTKASGVSTPDASFELMIDGVTKETVTGKQIYTRWDQVKLVRMGIVQVIAGTSTGHLKLDELVGNDKAGMIGLAP